MMLELIDEIPLRVQTIIRAKNFICVAEKAENRGPAVEC